MYGVKTVNLLDKFSLTSQIKNETMKGHNNIE
jgi:hypothetical protein